MAKLRIKIQGILVFTVLAAAILLFKFVFPGWKNEATDELWDFLGVGLVFLGMLLRVSARGYKAEASLNSARLVTGGPYALLRHPMYFGTLITAFGIITALFNWWAFILFGAVFLIIYAPEVKKEEAKLSAQFGEEYSQYCGKTPKYFPTLFKSPGIKIRNHLSFKLPWVGRELPSLTGILVVIILLGAWEDSRLFQRSEFKKEALEIFLVTLFFACLFILLFNKRHEK